MQIFSAVVGIWLIVNLSQPSSGEWIEEMTVEHNDDVTIECGYYGYIGYGIGLKPWKRDGKELPNSDRYTYLQDNTSLKIENIKDSDAGIYTCTVEIDVGDTYDATISVIVKPQSFRANMLPPDPVVYKVLGKDLVALCVVADLDPGSHLISIKWVDPEGQDFSTQNSPSTTIVQDTPERSRLFIKNLRSTDAGKYTCKIETSKDSESSIQEIEFELKLYEAPTGVTSSRHVFGRSNFITTYHNVLVCPEQSEKNPAIAWELNGKDLYNEMILGNTAYDIINWELRLRVNGSAESYGIYTCRRKDTTTGIITEHNINVTVAELAEVKIPKFEITVRPNSQVLLGCVVQGHPKPTTKWRFGWDTDIVESNRFKITEEGLLINSVKESDSGNYYCRAEQSELDHWDQNTVNLKVKPVTNEELFDLLEKNMKLNQQSSEEIIKALNTLISMQQQQQRPRQETF